MQFWQLSGPLFRTESGAGGEPDSVGSVLGGTAL